MFEAAGRAGAEYTGRGPVCGTISLLGGGAAGLCNIVAGLVGTVTVGAAAAAGASGAGFSVGVCAAGAAWTGASSTFCSGSTVSISTGIGGFDSTVSNVVAASMIADGAGASGTTAAADGADGFGGITTAAAGRATVCGVMRRGAGLGGSDGATGVALAATVGGFGATLGGREGTAAAGVTLVRGGTCGVTGRVDGAGCAAFWVIAFKTSPGFEICDRSIFGLNSSFAACDPLAAGVLPASPCSP
jgi:hypothetical protein